MKYVPTLVTIGALLVGQGCSSSSAPTTQPTGDTGTTDVGADIAIFTDAEVDAGGEQDVGTTDVPLADAMVPDAGTADGASMDVAAPSDVAPTDGEVDAASAVDAMDVTTMDVTVAMDVPPGDAGPACTGDPGSSPCGTGLACSATGVCVTLDALGAMCDPNVLTDVCPTAASCVGTGTAARCINDGSLGGACRTDPGTTVCDAGLGCQEGTCVAESAGYTESVLATPTWIDACNAVGGSHVVLLGGPGLAANRDDNHAMAAITLPFTFTFYGVAQTMAWPDINGYVQFGSEPEDALGGMGYIPSTSDGPVVAPFWDDLVLLDPIAPSTAENLCVATTGTAPGRAFVVEWLNAYRFGYMDTTLTFEAVLHETTNTVDFVYQTLAAATPADAMWVNGSNAAIGIQSDTGTQFDVHSGTVTTTTGITYTPE